MKQRLQVTDRADSGFTFIEIIITTFIIGTVVTGLFGLFVLSLRISHETERRIVAVALANEKMELVRNLPYVNVGTVGGVPAGPLLQEEQVERNALDYTVRMDIRYVDDFYDGEAPGTVLDEAKVTICHRAGTSSERTLVVGAPSLDAHLSHGDTQGACGEGGQGTAPEDEYNADYKQVRVEVSWNSNVNAKPVLLITYVTPQGIEGGELGGTLDFLALDTAGEGIAGATVHLVNSLVTPAIDLTTDTNSEGRLVLPGLPESAGSYEISVTKDGYTTEQTYDTTSAFIPDPDHSHLSMVLREVTPKTFVIDLLSQLNVVTQDDLEAAVPNLEYTLQGTKTIGGDSGGEPVYVLQTTASTDSSGQAAHEDLVWDTNSLKVDGAQTGYDIKETSVVAPFVV
ncbi:MAG: carboxypeptidase-like regulatory domain-containing protein, partial [Candidatus Andersenbacteria bacterium]